MEYKSLLSSFIKIVATSVNPILGTIAGPLIDAVLQSGGSVRDIEELMVDADLDLAEFIPDEEVYGLINKYPEESESLSMLINETAAELGVSDETIRKILNG